MREMKSVAAKHGESGWIAAQTDDRFVIEWRKKINNAKANNRNANYLLIIWSDRIDRKMNASHAHSAGVLSERAYY